MRRETENGVALFPWVTLSSLSHQSSRRGHGCRQWQALITHCSYALINWCSKTLAMICTKYSPSASVYGNVSFVQRCRAAQGRLLQGRAQSSDLIDPSNSMSAERSAGRSLTLSELAPVSLPSVIIKSILITLHKSIQGPSSSAVHHARAKLTQAGRERSNLENTDECKGSPSVWLHPQAR